MLTDHCIYIRLKPFLIRKFLIPFFNAVNIFRCANGFEGEKCEINMCLNYCLNGGVCSYSANQKAPVCECSSSYEGNRCEHLKTTPPILTQRTTTNDSCK